MDQCAHTFAALDSGAAGQLSWIRNIRRIFAVSPCETDEVTGAQQASEGGAEWSCPMIKVVIRGSSITEWRDIDQYPKQGTR
jgi:hypothetical protein